ncbi:F-box protein [Melia azedarach]|uniref:F-box protein n=1 Tax=Melia azedarach TaxID=155640 RepID=A0ACC1XRW0_MELAZ|nr:F-box protein [Melia azedarach]
MRTSILSLSDPTAEGPLSLIAQKLETRMNVRRLRAVCHSLRSAIPSQSKTTIPKPDEFKIPVPIGYISFNISHYILVESTVYAIQPLGEMPNIEEAAGTWFIKVEEPESGPVKLKDTLSDFEFENVSEELPIPLNLLDYHVKEIAKSYELIPVPTENPEVDHAAPLRSRRGFFVPEKVIVSEGLDIMVMHNRGMTLTMLRHGDKRWINVQDGYDINFDDIVYFDKKFYGITKSGHTLSYDCKTFSMSVVTFTSGNFGSAKLSLVKSDEDLFMIIQWRASSEIYKLGMFEWNKILHGYGDRVFFLGNSCSFSLLANEFPGCQKNSIYFSDATADDDDDGGDAPVFRRTGIFMKDDSTVRLLSDLPGRFQIFWPPPAWVKRI